MNAALEKFRARYDIGPQISASTPFGESPPTITGIDLDAFDGGIEVIRIARRYARFGNSLYQILNALIIARRLGCREVQLPSLDASPTRLPIFANDITVTGLRDQPTRPTLTAGFYAPLGFERLYEDFTSAFAHDTLTRYVRPIFWELSQSITPLADNVIAMHFRGGDVFSRNATVHSWYVQPPTSFYIKAFEYAERHFSVDRACLVFEDRSNPAVAAVETELARRGVPVILQSGTLLADLRCLSGARHLVRPFGTFCEAIALLSEHCKSLFSFRQVSTQEDIGQFTQSRVCELLQRSQVRTIVVSDLDGRYIRPRQWNASEEQLQQIRAFPGEFLEATEKTPPPYLISSTTGTVKPPRSIPHDLDCSLLSARRHQDALRLGRKLDATPNLYELADFYASYDQTNLPDLIAALQSRIDGLARDQGLLKSPTESGFLETGEMTQPLYAALFPNRPYPYFPGQMSPEVEEFPILSETTNEFFDDSVPRHVSMISYRPLRSRMSIYALRAATLYVHPSGYQVHDGRGEWYVPEASSRAHTRAILGAPSSKTIKDLVIVQDRFWGGSFAHFFYDWLTRVSHFCMAGLTNPRDCLFVMGGAPGEFHDLMLSSACRHLGLTSDNFYFPVAEQNIRTEGRIFWFGDQRAFMHPAQMCHPRSIAAIRMLVADISTSVSPWPYVYISRVDAESRRLANEAELWPHLEALGFKRFELAHLPILEQLAIFRGARLIVAPHGMGLVNIVFNQGPLRVVELHSPDGGTDAYTVISKAMGFNHDCIVGVRAHPLTGDFTVQWHDLAPKLEPWLQAAARSNENARFGVNLLPASATFASGWLPGAQSEAAQVEIDEHAPVGMSINAVVVHRVDGRSRTADANVGYFELPPVEPFTLHTASCWVWIPRDFPGDAVFLSLGEWEGQSCTPADLKRRDCWQRIHSAIRSPEKSRVCNIVMRVSSATPCRIYSTCWQLEVGEEPTEYMATGITA